MKFKYCQKFITALLIFISSSAIAQWSVIEGDPRIGKNKGEEARYQVFTQKEWNASNFATPEQMKWHDDARYGMFIHFGLNSYVNKDMSWPIVYNRKAPDKGHGSYPDSAWQKTWPSLFKLEKFDADEWVKIAKDAGMRYIVVIAKHHDGFHMWDTQFSDFKITNTPFKRDYLKEIIDACHKANMPIGLYYSQRDWYHPDYAPIDTNTIKTIQKPPYYEALPGKKVVAGPTHQKYIDYQFNVVKELLTKYGKIDIFWFDAAYWGGMFKADMWDAERLTRMVRKLQPDIIINNRTSLPGDFDTPEQRIGMYQSRSWESAMTLNGSWAYNPDLPIKPVKSLLKEILTAASGNGNVLLSWGAHFDGEWDSAQKDTLLKVGNWLKKHENAYYNTRGGPWMPNKNFGSVYKSNKVYLYIFNWEANTQVLPELVGNKILQAKFMDSEEKVVWQVANNTITIHKPTIPNEVATIVELTMSKPITQVLKSTELSSLFNDPAYGEKIVQKDFKTSDWSNDQYIFDLGKIKNVTGVGINKNEGKLTISTSVNGKDWSDANIVDERKKEISITTFMTGVLVPGRATRYIRLQTNTPKILSFEIFEKQ